MSLGPFSPRLIFIGLILLILIIIVQIEIFGFVLTKLGLSRHSVSLLLITTFLGSVINLPLIKVRSNFDPEKLPHMPGVMIPINFQAGYTQLAINVGGGLIPLGFSTYLIFNSDISLISILMATVVISTISYLFSRPIKNLGIGMPLFIAPVSAAIFAMLLSRENAPVIAYISGTLGVLIGADVLRIKNIQQLNTPIASIGGAGTFDGIFMTGIIAVLLTY